MNNKNQISVIIPTLNESELLPKLLSELSLQTFQDFELIIVDAQSEDNTQEIVKDFAKKNSKIKLLVSTTRDVIYQKNLGAQKAGGNWLVFIDADVRIGQDWMQNLYETIQKPSTVFYILPFGKTGTDKVLDALLPFCNDFVALTLHTNRPFTTGSQFLVYKPIFDLVGGFESGIVYAEDQNLVAKTQKVGVVAQLLSNAAVGYSSRRFEREGYFVTIYKLFQSWIHLLKHGEIKKPLFEYEMGGGLKKQNNTLSKFMAKKIKSQFEYLQKNLKIESD